MNDLEQRVKALESKVKILEETLETIKKMSLSEQMGDFIQSRQKSLRMVDLLNSVSDEDKLNLDKEREAVEKVRATKTTVDKQIAQALKNTGTFSEDFPDDPRYFNYEIESGLKQFAGKGIRITAYNGFETNRVIIPSEIDGIPVISIGEKAFMNTAISEVVLPKTIKAILSEAFGGCKNLTHIDLPDTVEYWGDYCFRGTSLVEFNCPDSLKKIPTGCFQQCAKLRTVNLGNRIETLGTFAFNGCNNLESILLPESLEEVQIWCFKKTKISTVIFPSNVRKVSGETFGNEYRRNAGNITCVFLGKDTTIGISRLFESFVNVSLIYCLPGSKIQQIAREYKIPIKPLSEFRMEDYQ